MFFTIAVCHVYWGSGFCRQINTFSDFQMSVSRPKHRNQICLCEALEKTTFIIFVLILFPTQSHKQ